MEDKTESGIRRVLRIHVEPVEVELDEEGAILITTLQSALPGASGLYFHDNDCKASLRFNGKKLLPPADGWKDRKYYATLGCRPFDYPFGSYANASRNFERAVNTIQRLLANPKLFVSDSTLIGRDIITTKRAAAHRASPLGNVKTENMQQLLTVLTKENALETAGITGEEQTPLEQQFVELARISTAKDSIIEQQRADIKDANEKLEQKERSMKNVQDDMSKLMKSCSAKEEELAVLRDLSKQHQFISEKVNELTNKLMDRDNIITAQRKEIEFLVRKMAGLDFQRIPSQKISELGTSTESATESNIEALGSPGNQNDQNIREDEMTTEELLNALARIKVRNEQLENEVNLSGERYQHLNEVYTAVVAENTKLMAQLAQLEHDTSTSITIKKESQTNVTTGDESHWTDERLMTLRKELTASEKRIAELTRMVHVLTKEASDSELRAADAIATRNEMKRSLDHAETKIQEAVQAERRECEFVRHDLQDAKKLIAELNALIADFSSDARNSRRDDFGQKKKKISARSDTCDIQ